MRRCWYLLLLLLATGASAEVPDFKAIHDLIERRQQFVDFLLPHVRAANEEVWQQRQWVMRLNQVFTNDELSDAQVLELLELGTQYRMAESESIDQAYFSELLQRVDVIPASLVLAQAANESGWGTSRFARDGLNYFGIWCYRPGCGIKPARREGDATHEVRRFESVADSVRAYIAMLNSRQSYVPVRTLREEARNSGAEPTGVQLAAGLIRYSQLREAYVRAIQNLIRRESLERYTLDRSGPSGPEAGVQDNST